MYKEYDLLREKNKPVARDLGSSKPLQLKYSSPEEHAREIELKQKIKAICKEWAEENLSPSEKFELLRK